MRLSWALKLADGIGANFYVLNYSALPYQSCCYISGT